MDPVHVRPKHILVVEDDPEIRAVLVDILEGEGYSVAVASNGQDALERIAAQRPDAILLDLRMPIMDGWRFLEHRQATGEGKDFPVLVLSAANDEELDRAKALGATDWMTKPFELARLVGQVAKLTTAEGS